MRRFTQTTDLALRNDRREKWLYRCEVRQRYTCGPLFTTDYLPAIEALVIAEVFREAIDQYWEYLCESEDDDDLDPYVYSGSIIMLSEHAFMAGREAIAQHLKMKEELVEHNILAVQRSVYGLGSPSLPPPQGSTFDPAIDGPRLARQAKLVWACMTDGQWRTLAEIRAATDQPEASISARLRDLRKDGVTVDRRRRGEPRDGVWEYRVGVEK